MALAESYSDPLNEFASEAPPQSAAERVDYRAPQEPAAPPLFNLAYDAYAPSSAIRAPRRRWVAAAVMLCIGLAAGFAAAMAVITRYGDPELWLRTQNVDRVQPVASNPAQHAPSPSRPVAAPATNPLLSARVGAERREVETRPEIPPGAVAVLYVQSRPMGAQVYVDDQLITTTPFQLADIALGLHTIRVEMPGYHPWIESIDVQVGSRITIAAALEQ